MRPRAGTISDTNPAAAGPVVFLDLFAGAGRDQITDLIRASDAVRASGIHRVRTVEDRAWANDSAALHLIRRPASREEWARRSGPGDIAVVVTRDPRDLVAGFARTSAELHPGLSTRERLLLAMTRLKDQERMLRSWAGRTGSATELVVGFEDVAEDTSGFLGRLTTFLEQGPPLGDRPSGDRSRPFGSTDTATLHLDGGDTVGAWRTVFDHELADAFEQVFPGLVVELGLDDSDWPDRTVDPSLVTDLGFEAVERSTHRPDLFSGV